MVRRNTFKVGPRVEGNTTYLDMHTKSNLGSIVFENGQFYQEIDKVRTSLGGGTSPGGADTQIQFNNAGSFDGDSNLTWDGTSLTIGTLTSIDDLSNSAFLSGSDEAGTASTNIALIGYNQFKMVGGLSIQTVSAATSNPPTNAEIEANAPVQNGVTSNTGLTYYLLDTVTSTLYNCHARAAGTWDYVAMTAAV